jgi:hypothetical protein
MAQQYDLTSSDGILSYLHAHGYPSCFSVDRLAEGWSGFVYRAQIGDDIDRQHPQKRSGSAFTESL